jgi:hypothetical protein
MATLVLSSLILLWFLVLWFVVPNGLVAWPATIFHILGAAILITLGRRLPLMIREVRDTRAALVGWGLTAYCADVSRHIFGNTLFVIVFAFEPKGFLPIMPQTAIEQTMFAVSSALIGVPALLTVKNAKLDVPIIRPERRKKSAKGNKSS